MGFDVAGSFFESACGLLGPLLGHFGTLLSPLGSPVAPLGTRWGCPLALLGPPWVPWAALGPPSASLEDSLRCLWASLGRPWCVSRALRLHRKSEIHRYVVSSLNRAGKLGMGFGESK